MSEIVLLRVHTRCDHKLTLKPVQWNLHDDAVGSHLSAKCSRLRLKNNHFFSSAIRLLHQDLRQPIYNIYGFVRFADEIVDTFHGFDKHELLQQFKSDTAAAIERGLSLNPILHSFQLTVKQYAIDLSLVDAFFKSRMMTRQKIICRAEYDEIFMAARKS